VGEHGRTAWAPVDDVGAPVDQALAVEAHERFAHGARQAGVEREALAGPVARGAEALELLDDPRAVLLLTLPDAFDEALAAEVEAGLALLRQRGLDHVLRRDAGVVGAGEPE